MGKLNVDRVFHVLDMFGASQRISQAWEERGYLARAFDVKISNLHDICSEAGMKILATMGMEHPDALTS